MSEKFDEMRHQNKKEKPTNYCNNKDEDINKISSSIINKNKDQQINIKDNILTTIQTNEINVENSMIIGTKLVETDNNDERYLKAIKQKGEIAILKGENKLLEIIKLGTLEKILSFLGTNLKEFYYDISFGIYSCEEIIELRKTLETNKKGNYFKKDSNKYIPYLNLNEKQEKISLPNDIVPDSQPKEKDLQNNEDLPTKRKTEIQNEKLLEIQKKVKILDELYKLNQKNERDNLNELNNKKNIIMQEIKKEDKKENEKIEENNDKIIDDKKMNKILTLKKSKNEGIKKKTEPKNLKKIKKDLTKTKVSQNKISINNNKSKKKLTIINSNNYLFNKNEKLLTPNKIKNRKTNKTRNVSSILQNKNQSTIYNRTEISRETFRKKKINTSLTYVKKKSNINKKKDMNVKTFKCNKSNVKNKNDDFSIKEFYQINKDRYNNIYWHTKENINNKNNIKEIKQSNTEIEKLKKNIKCIKCGVDIIKNKGIYKCDKCKGFICGNCSKIHYLKNPEQKSYYINIKEESSNDKNKITNNICFDSLINKSISPNNIHLKNKDKYKKIRSNEITFSLSCVLCNELFSFNEECFCLTNCPNCKGNICLKCFNEHINKYPEHNFIKMKILLIQDNTSYDYYSLPKLYCGNCQKQKNDFDNIYYCEKCKINLCEECKNKHYIKYKEHSLFLIKRILVLDEICLKNKEEIKCRQCEADLGENSFSFRQCNQCKISLCFPCSESHLEKYPNHNIIYTIVNKNKIDNKINNIGSTNENQKYKKFDFDNENKSNTLNCINCKSKINNINNCNYCYGYLCSSCKDDENLNLFKINSFNLPKIIMKEYINNNANFKLHEGKKICQSCNKKAFTKHFCINCRTEFCINCAEKHNNDNQEHILILIKNY